MNPHIPRFHTSATYHATKFALLTTGEDNISNAIIKAFKANTKRSDNSIEREMQEAINNIDVAEVYSPPRVGPVAEEVGLVRGASMDLRTVDSEGRPWD